MSSLRMWWMAFPQRPHLLQSSRRGAVFQACLHSLEMGVGKPSEIVGVVLTVTNFISTFHIYYFSYTPGLPPDVIGRRTVDDLSSMGLFAVVKRVRKTGEKKRECQKPEMGRVRPSSCWHKTKKHSFRIFDFDCSICSSSFSHHETLPSCLDAYHCTFQSCLHDSGPHCKLSSLGTRDSP